MWRPLAQSDCYLYLFQRSNSSLNLIIWPVGAVSMALFRRCSHRFSPFSSLPENTGNSQVMGKVIPDQRGSDEGSLCRAWYCAECGSDRTPVVQGVIPGRCGRRRRDAPRRKATGAPNTSLQPTAFRRARSELFCVSEATLARNSWRWRGLEDGG